MKRLASEWALAWLMVGLGALGVTAGCSDDTDEPGGSAGSSGSAGATSGGTAGSAHAGNASSGSHDGGTPAGGSGGAGGSSGSATGGTEPTGGAEPIGGEAGQSQGGVGGEASGGVGGVGGDEAAGAGGEAPCVPGAPTLPLDVPALIAAPAGTTLLRHFHAVGTQNYVCTKGAGDNPTYTWVFVAPVADLSNSCGVTVGHHFAAPNTAPPVPVWKYDADGSSVKGKRLQLSPVVGAIPELLLQQDGHDGAGLFAAVTFVQRLKTVGGAAPAADTCTAAHENEPQNVPYTAEYYFYTGGD